MSADSTVATQIRTALAQHLKRDVSKIRPEDNLRADLGLDSLAMIELLFKIEEAFDLEIPNDDLSKIATVSDVVAYVEERLQRPREAARPRAAAPRPSTVAAAPPAPKAPAKRAPVKKKGSRRA
jgi:acyl carrier protein